MEFFMTQQQNLRKQICKVVGLDPFSAVADMAQKNFTRWKVLQEEVLQRFSEASLLEDRGGKGISATHKEA